MIIEQLKIGNYLSLPDQESEEKCNILSLNRFLIVSNRVLFLFTQLQVSLIWQVKYEIKLDRSLKQVAKA